MLAAAYDFGLQARYWPWIWMGLAIALAFIELVFVGGSFAVLPWSMSAFVAGIVGFFGAPIVAQWAVFGIGGVIAYVLVHRWLQRFAAQLAASSNGGEDPPAPR